MKAGKTNIEVNSRVVLVKSKRREYLGATGTIVQPQDKESIGLLLLDEPQKYGVHSINLLTGERILELPDDTGKHMAGKSNIPMNEPVLLLVENEELAIYGYITNPSENWSADSSTVYIAGVRTGNPNDDCIKNIYNVTEDDILIRYPLNESDEEKITESSQVLCIWDEDGIFVDVDYGKLSPESDEESTTCFIALYEGMDGELYTREIPSEDTWINALKVADFMRWRFDIPLTLDKFTGKSFKNRDVFQEKCINCGKSFITKGDREENLFCPDCNKVCSNTPAGILTVEKKGTKDEYPGFYISIKNGNEEKQCVTVEYDTVKEYLQVVMYNNSDDEPLAVITLGGCI